MDSSQKLRITLESLPSREIIDRLVRLAGEAFTAAQKIEVPFAIPPISNWWRGDSRSGFEACIGKQRSGEKVPLKMGRGLQQHGLMVGKTASGKSMALGVVAVSSCVLYPPDELELYIIDFKEGVEFTDFADSMLPHLRVIAIESDREFGLSVLQKLQRELQSRGVLFRDHKVSNIEEYRNQTESPLARILLIADEFQVFFANNDRISSEASTILEDLLRRGRAFGIHILLASQSVAGGLELSRGAMGQMGIRIAFQCSDTDSLIALGDDNPAALTLKLPGEAIYNDANGAIDGNIHFQVFYLSSEVRQRILHQLHEKNCESGLQQLEPFVFEGNAQSDFGKNAEIRNFLGSADYPDNPKISTAWLGDPIAIKPPTCAHFGRMARSNLLIVGWNKEASISMLQASFLSKVMQHSPATASFGLIDSRYDEVHMHDSQREMTELVPHQTSVVGTKYAESTLESIAGVVRERGKNVEKPIELNIYLFIFGLHSLRQLRSSDPYSLTEGAENLALILRDGPELGVHSLIWCDTLTNLTRVFERSILNEFDMRVILQMNPDDSIQLIDTPVAATLGPNRAFFYDEEKVGSDGLEKFRPYSQPNQSIIDMISTALNKRTQNHLGKNA